MLVVSFRNNPRQLSWSSLSHSASLTAFSISTVKHWLQHPGRQLSQLRLRHPSGQREDRCKRLRGPKGSGLKQSKGGGTASRSRRTPRARPPSPRRVLNPPPGCGQTVALPLQPWPTAALGFPASSARASRSVSRRPAGDARPVGGAAGPGAVAPSAHPEAAAARRAPRECTARRAAGREARRGLEGGSRREPPPLAARVPGGRMGRSEPGSHAGPAPSFLLP